ncbi:class I SAM-dependent RNA methyltransferase [Blastochloris viridis]|uniref:23S rRNA (Uracil(1939)-C(5))-methyltransferase RlmD n=1 Tax=Blastochloris viridis TaxID=1079 RepID=A0A0H5BDW2_BLAVI|nr:methyltransferase [Blastochloris viridis]ALK09728.1 23S rRNA (uracil(1939)-C(5))-methyltransferase RlmD [Blastochloris viridis]BAS00378.1 23S rRNA (Uracil-5-) -methyltransferase RumA [Blastochloris viridis]CUU42391.1 23S rRNA (uracil(1939)-C(5))-methyltransferase RlmD [Blastochloris viridis]
MTTERLTIACLGHRGDGCAQTADGPLYVPFTLPGEEVEVQRVPGKDRADLVQVIRPSADRVEPFCPHFGVCGGCALQHMAEPAYRAFKHGIVVSALADAGLDVEVADIVPAHGRGRRRATFHARSTAHDVLAVGFMAQRAHRVVPIDDCPILDPGLAGAVTACWAVAEALAATGKPLDIQVTATDGGLDVDVSGCSRLPERLRQTLVRMAGAQDLARLTLAGDLIVKRRPTTIAIGRASVELPPGAFLQATDAGDITLATLVREMAGKLAGKAAVLDLFAGVGTFALRLAETVRVTAVDGDAAAIAALDAAVRATQGLKPLTTEARDLFRRPLVAAELKPFRVVVFDPPRQGAEAQARRLADSAVPAIGAVSCNPSTFARDAKLLVAGGYRLTRVVPVDQFAWSPHVEVVARFER